MGDEQHRKRLKLKVVIILSTGNCRVVDVILSGIPHVQTSAVVTKAGQRLGTEATWPFHEANIFIVRVMEGAALSLVDAASL